MKFEMIGEIIGEKECFFPKLMNKIYQTHWDYSLFILTCSKKSFAFKIQASVLHLNSH